MKADKFIEASRALQEPATVEHQLTGIAGEFFVAAELAKRNFQVALTLGNAKGIDLLAICIFFYAGNESKLGLFQRTKKVLRVQ